MPRWEDNSLLLFLLFMPTGAQKGEPILTHTKVPLLWAYRAGAHRSVELCGRQDLIGRCFLAPGTLLPPPPYLSAAQLRASVGL